MDLARGPTELEELGHLFASPDRLVEAAGARARRRSGDDGDELAGPGLEELVAELRTLAKKDPTVRPELAGRLHELSTTLLQLGRRAEALPPIEEAVTIHRDLADENPDAFLPDLAGSLNTLSNRLSDLGRHHDALPPIEQAVAIRRDLAATNPGAHLLDLATSLNQLADVLEELGRGEEAEARRLEVGGIRRSLLAPPDQD